MSILAIDPGVNTAIAISTGHIETFVCKKDDIAFNTCRWGNYLKELFYRYQVTQIIIERPFFPPRCKGDVVDLTNAIIFETHRQGYIHQINRAEYSAMTARKILLGRGRRLKGESIKSFDAAIKFEVIQYGFDPMNEHEADAAALICAYRKLNHCEGQTLDGTTLHNGSDTKGTSNGKFKATR